METENGCEKDLRSPTPEPEITSSNSVQINFDEKISTSLTIEDILSVKISGPRADGYDFTWKLVENVEQESYTLVLEFDHEDIPDDTTIDILLNPDIQDIDGNKISNNLISAELKSQEESPPKDEALAEELGDTMSDTNKIAMTASVASGGVTGEFGSAWNMLNTLQMLAFVPMMPN